MSVARHSVYNAIGAALPVAAALVTVPLYLKTIGLNRYGVLNLCWLLVGYFGLFDLGLGRATAKQIASLDQCDDEARSHAFWAALTLSGAFAVVGLLLAYTLAQEAIGALKLPLELRIETIATIPLLVAAVAVSILQSVLRGALEGRREFLIVNAILSVGTIATAVFPLVLALTWGPHLVPLVAMSVAIRIIVVAGMAIACRSAVPVFRYEGPAFGELGVMLRFGAWLTVTNIIGPLMVFADRYIIGATLGAAAVALYAIPFNLITQLVLLPLAFGTALFPKLVAAPRGSRLSEEALFASTFVMTPAAIAAILIIGPFLTVWIGGASAATSTRIAWVLIVGFWANGLAQLPFTSLLATGRTEITAKLHLAEIVPYLVLLWLALSQFGIVGAAIVWSVRSTIDFIALAAFDGISSRVLRSTIIQGMAVLMLSLTMFKVAASPTKWVLVVVITAATLAYLIRVIPPRLISRIRGLMVHLQDYKRLS